MNSTLSRQDYYYLQPFNLWNATNSNAFPNIRDYSNFVADTVGRDYENSMTTKQGINTAATGALVMPLTSNFSEKGNI